MIGATALAVLIWLAQACVSFTERDYPYPEHNPPSQAGIILGRSLFYDEGLSANGQVSCASCHQQQLAFSDGQPLSTLGVSGQALSRHTPALINLAWTDGLFWDGGVLNLESLSFGPLSHPDEMGINLQTMVEQLQADATYRAQFAASFGTDSITSPLVGRALAQFCRELVSKDAPYDRYLRGEAMLSPEAIRGLELVNQHCSPCHTGSDFTDDSYHNNGLDRWPLVPGEQKTLLGRYRITYDSADLGRFKTPTLRNVLVTAPYMHDGRFATIDEVLEHYSTGVSPSPTRASELAGGLGLSQQEKQDIVAFLGTLTDSAFLTNRQLGKPI